MPASAFAPACSRSRYCRWPLTRRSGPARRRTCRVVPGLARGRPRPTPGSRLAAQDEAVLAARRRRCPTASAFGRRRADDVGRVELEGRPARRPRRPRLPCSRRSRSPGRRCRRRWRSGPGPACSRRPVFEPYIFVRLVDPGVRPLRAGDAAGVVVAAPEDERLAVLEPGLQVAAERLAAAQVDHRRRAGVAREVLGDVVLRVGAAVASGAARRRASRAAARA